MEVVYAIGSEMVDAPSGIRVKVTKGTHWPAGDPVVRKRPDLFSHDPRYGMLFTAEPAGYDESPGGSLVDEPVRRSESDVETATANPGERRNTRRDR